MKVEQTNFEMNKKKILIFIDWYLPGYKAGGPIQSVANLVAHLKEEFDISIITRDTDYSDKLPYPTIKSNEWIEHDGIRVYYFSKAQLNYSGIHRLIAENPSDYVYLNGIYSLYFTLIPLFVLRKKKGHRIVIAVRGMLSQGSLNVKKTKKNLFLRMVKMAKLFSGVTFHATTDQENKDIRGILGHNIQIKTAGNLPAVVSLKTFQSRKKDPGTVRLINIARIAPEKNLLKALQILQSVTQPVIFDFYGPVYDQAYWLQCKEALKALPTHIRATYKGSLESSKVIETLQQAHFLFMPTTGENFGHIILQSFLASCPVIISDQTPWRDLETKKCGWTIPLEQTEKYSQVIDRVSNMQQTEYDDLARSAFAFAEQYIDNPQTVIDNKALFILQGE